MKLMIRIHIILITAVFFLIGCDNPSILKPTPTQHQPRCLSRLLPLRLRDLKLLKQPEQLLLR
jgi:hypothetical protein